MERRLPRRCDGLQPITGVSLATQADALLAQGQIDGYLDSVNKVSGTIGTALSRFQIAAHVASSVADVSQAAEARITDADVADNTAALVRNQILQQASCGGARTGEPTTRVGPYSAPRVGNRPRPGSASPGAALGGTLLLRTLLTRTD